MMKYQQRFIQFFSGNLTLRDSPRSRLLTSIDNYNLLIATEENLDLKSRKIVQKYNESIRSINKSFGQSINKNLVNCFYMVSSILNFNQILSILLTENYQDVYIIELNVFFGQN